MSGVNEVRAAPAEAKAALAAAARRAANPGGGWRKPVAAKPRPRTPSPPRGPVRRVPLDTLADVQRELGRVYREARSRRLDWAGASRAAHILGLLGRLIEGNKLGRRLEAARPTSADPRAEALTARMKELDDDQLLELVELTHDPGCAACAAALAAWFAGAAEARVLFGGPGPPTLDVEDPPEPCPSCAAYVEGRRAAVFGPVP